MQVVFDPECDFCEHFRRWCEEHGEAVELQFVPASTPKDVGRRAEPHNIGSKQKPNRDEWALWA